MPFDDYTKTDNSCSVALESVLGRADDPARVTVTVAHQHPVPPADPDDDLFQYQQTLPATHLSSPHHRRLPRLVLAEGARQAVVVPGRLLP